MPNAMANSRKAPEAYWSQFIFSNNIISDWNFSFFSSEYVLGSR